MRRAVLGIIILLLISSCTTEKINGQQKNEDSLIVNKPQTKIIVNKEYDENGNLISFDSSYSYLYTNVKQDSIFGDSSYTMFQQKFFNSFPKNQRPFLNEIFFEDTLLSNDFFMDDFFSKRYRLNHERFDEFFRDMDSVKNNF